MKKIFILLAVLILTISVFGIYNPDEDVSYCDEEKTVVCGAENDTVEPTLMVATTTALEDDSNLESDVVEEPNYYTNGVAKFDLSKITVFHGEGCPHCAKLLSYLNKMKKSYPTLEYDAYEVYRVEDNRNLILNYLESQGKEFQGVPTTVYKGAVFVGFDKNVQEALESIIVENHTYVKPMSFFDKIVAFFKGLFD